jgi:hypothetical protein
VRHAKDADGGEAASLEPDSPPSDGMTPFERFVDFARKVIAVPRAEIEEQERIYQATKKRRRRPPKKT